MTMTTAVIRWHLLTYVHYYLLVVRQQSTGLSADPWQAVQQEAQFTVLHRTSCTACLRKSSVHLLHLHPWNVCLATVSLRGLFMRPRRARMGDKMLSDLVFLKCNKRV